jgi:hypothetical protein
LLNRCAGAGQPTVRSSCQPSQRFPGTSFGLARPYAFSP